MFLKKLHIKILSVALLVVLISYNTFDSQVLPQQFASEYVEYTDVSEVVVCYSSTYVAQVTTVSEYVVFDFQNYVSSFNGCQNVVYKQVSFKRRLIKKHQQKSSLLSKLIIPSKDIHTSFI